MSLLNPIQYTSRDFDSIMSDINNDAQLIDKPDWFKRIMAGIGDMLSLIIDAQANNSYLGTAFTRRAVVELARMIDYQAAPQSTATGTLLFYLKSSVSYPIAIAKADLVGSTQGSISQSSRRFEARADFSLAAAVSETFAADASSDWLVVARVYKTGERIRLTTTGTLPPPLAAATDYYAIFVDATHIRIATSLANAYAGSYINITGAGSPTNTATLFSIQVTCYQQLTRDLFVCGRGDGVTPWLQIDLPDADILRDTIALTINSLAWTRVDSLINSGATDRHFRLIYNSDNTSYIEFGNGVYGAIPGSYDVYSTYGVGGNATSNVSAVNGVNIYSGADANIDGVSNPAALTGGSDPESSLSVQKQAPLLLKSRDRFVTLADGIALITAYGGLSLATINANFYGVLSCQILAIAVGGGNPTTPVKTAIITYLQTRDVLNSIDIRFDDATITAKSVTAQINIGTGYAFANVQPFAVLALRLFFTEKGAEILGIYRNQGVAAAAAWINSVWSTSFGAADYNQLQELLGPLVPRNFGDQIQESQCLGYIQENVFGVNYVTISAPSFPIALAADEITKEGTMTVTEV